MQGFVGYVTDCVLMPMGINKLDLFAPSCKTEVLS